MKSNANADVKVKEKIKIDVKEIFDDVWVNLTITAISTYFMTLLGMHL